MGKLYVSRYSGSRSIGGNAFNDLLLACMLRLFADNVCHGAKPGDMILVFADECFILFHVLSENLGPSIKWEEKGGLSWRYSYKVAKLTPIISISSDLMKQMQGLCEKRNIPFRGKNGNILLFHGNRFNGGHNKSEYAPVIHDYIRSRRAAVSPALPR
jgi:hypothetical protein